MKRVQEIDQRIAELQREHDDVQGTPTEIYTRIVGYYRSLKNWNKGKREEYDHRITFDGDQETDGITPALSDQGEHDQPMQRSDLESLAHEYLYFYRESCPNCPPVKQRLEQSNLTGNNINVDTERGVKEAIAYQVLSTPTVVLLNSDGSVRQKLTSRSQVDAALATPV